MVIVVIVAVVVVNVECFDWMMAKECCSILHGQSKVQKCTRSLV